MSWIFLISNLEKRGLNNKFQLDPELMGLISELGLAFKNTLYYLNVFWGGRKIVEGGLLGPGLRFGGIHMWDRCRFCAPSL